MFPALHILAVVLVATAMALARPRARARTTQKDAVVEGAIFGDTADLLSRLYNWRCS
jgi:hypothetical protein